MAITSCPNPSPECRYYNRQPPEQLKGEQKHGCRADKSHKHAQKLASTALEEVFINLPENTRQECRREHEQYDRKGTLPLPERDVMYQAILDALQAGRLTLSKTKRKKVLRGT